MISLIYSTKVHKSPNLLIKYKLFCKIHILIILQRRLSLFQRKKNYISPPVPYLEVEEANIVCICSALLSRVKLYINPFSKKNF